MGILSSLFGLNVNSDKIVSLQQKGAVILDVRSPQEFSQGHIKGSRNIPLNQIKGQMGRLKKENRPFICCCASGNRSGMAVQMLQSNGIEAENGGGWKSLEKLVE